MKYHYNNYNTPDSSVVFRKILTPYFSNNQSKNQMTTKQSCFKNDKRSNYLSKSNKTEFMNTPTPNSYLRSSVVDSKINNNAISFIKNNITSISDTSPPTNNPTDYFNYCDNNPYSRNRRFLEDSSFTNNKHLNMENSYITSPRSFYYSNTQQETIQSTEEGTNYRNNSSKPIKSSSTNDKYQAYRPTSSQESPNNIFNKRSVFILSSKSHENTESNYNNYCNNCGKTGHGFYHCKNPITSYGIIVFRYVHNQETNTKERQYLMIRRRDTISYVDFLRGKYSLFNRKYIKRLINDMSEIEQNQIMTKPFDHLWYELWKNNEPTSHDELSNSIVEMNTNLHTTNNFNTSIDNTHFNDKFNIRHKFNILQNGLVVNGNPHFTITDIVNEIRMEQKTFNTESWKEPEWGFCKGRRNYKENDYDCAIREMQEETGYSKEDMSILKNINTFEEVFIGSNLKSYRHKYYIMYMTYEDSLKTGDFEKTEVSCIKWVPFNECLLLIRSYNVEKKRMITDINNALNKYCLFDYNVQKDK